MFEDQIAAIDKFSQMRVGALFMGMGTGKTRTALELCRHNQDEVDLVLWLAPKSTITNLKAELSQCEPLNIPLEAYGYETLASSDKQYVRLLDRLKGRRIFLICDESLYLKNGETKRWRRTNHIRQQLADFALILNGTPVTRDEMDLYWQMQLLSPQIIGMRVTATVQFNRARGTHQIVDMSKLVIKLVKSGMPDEEIMERLGMEPDEMLRLKQISGIKEAFGNKQFAKSWKEFVAKYPDGHDEKVTISKL